MVEEYFPKVMGRKDAADLLGVSKQYLDHLVQRGILRYCVTSAGYIFLESDVKALKEERKATKAQRASRSKARVKRA